MLLVPVIEEYVLFNACLTNNIYAFMIFSQLKDAKKHDYIISFPQW